MKRKSVFYKQTTEKNISDQESPMNKDRKTCYSPEYPDKSQQPGVPRGPKEGLGEQTPKGEGGAFVNYPGSLDFVLRAVGNCQRALSKGKHCGIKMFKKLSLATG